MCVSVGVFDLEALNNSQNPQFNGFMQKQTVVAVRGQNMCHILTHTHTEFMCVPKCH